MKLLFVFIGIFTVFAGKQASASTYELHKDHPYIHITNYHERIPDWVQDIVDNLIKHIKDVIKEIQDMLTNAMNSAMETIEKLVQNVLDTVQKTVDSLKDELNELGNDVQCAIDQSEKLDNIVSQVTSDTDQCTSQAVEKMNEIQDEVSKLIEQLMNKIKDLSNVINKCSTGSPITVVSCILKETGDIAKEIESIFVDAKHLVDKITDISVDATTCITGVLNNALKDLAKIAEDVDQCIKDNSIKVYV